MQEGVGMGKRALVALAWTFAWLASATVAAQPAPAPGAGPVSPAPAAAAPATSPDPAPASEPAGGTRPEPSTAVPAAAPSAQPAAVSAPAIVPAPSAPPGDAACLLGEHDGIPRADARTSAALMCTALRDKGAKVRTTPLEADQSLGFAAAYRIALRPLGTLIVLHVSYEAPVGEELRSQRLRLGSIEEVPVAAPRVADALLFGKPLAETARVDNLVAEETRKSRKMSGETFFAVGVLGFAIPDQTWAGYGAFARFHYQTSAYAVGIDGRIGTSTERDGDAHLFGLSVGGRYYLGDADVSAFLGGGLGVLWFGTNEYSNGELNEFGYYEGEGEIDHAGSGLAPFVEGGVELLRMHESRLDIGLRVDLPLFAIGGPGQRSKDDKSYAVPISLFASYSFD